MHYFVSYNGKRSFSNSQQKADVFTDKFGSGDRLSHRRTRYFDHPDSGNAPSSNLQASPLLHRSDSSWGETKTGLEHHDCSGCQRVVINVCGMKFETQMKTLDRLPNTLLGNPDKRKQFWDPKRQEYFLDRHRPTFQAVLYFYQSGGKLKRPIEVPSDVFFSELEFYELGDGVIESYKRSLGYIIEKRQQLSNNKLKQNLWFLFEEPSSSWFATFVMIISIMAIFVSVVGFCLETIPEYRNKTCGFINKDGVMQTSMNVSRELELPYRGSNSKMQWKPNINDSANTTDLKASDGIASRSVIGWTKQKTPPNYQDPFFIVEAVCVFWFSVEFLARFYASPSKCDFLKQFVNLIDIVAIFPFFVTLLIGVATGSCVDTSKSGFLLVIRVIKVMRIFKLGKHSQGLQILAKTVTASIRELSLFVMFLAIAVVVFSAAMYHAEYDGNSSFFPSIPGTFWYTIVTMTTVGYGDAVPIGVAGKMIGSLCVLAGVLVIALPVPVVVTNFSNYYFHATGKGIGLTR